MLFKLARNDELAANLYFLLFQVARVLDHFHAITQRMWDGRKRVRRCDEQNVGKIEIEFQIMVAEGVILFQCNIRCYNSLVVRDFLFRR